MVSSVWFSLNFFFINETISQMERFLDLTCLSVSANQHGSEELLQEYVDEHGNKFVPEEFVDEYLEVAQDFPQFAFGAFIVSWYSFVEQKLCDLAKSAKAEYRIETPVSRPPRESVISSARRQLEELGFSFDQENWEKLDNVRRLRNHIVHMGYYVVCIPIEEDVSGQSLRGGRGYTTPDGDLYSLGREYSGKYNEVKCVLEHAFTQEILQKENVHFHIVPTERYCRQLLNCSKILFNFLSEQEVRRSERE